MSRTATALLNSLVNFTLLPLNQRQRQKTKARLASAIKQQGARVIETPRGNIKFHALQGAGVASIVETFQTDEPETRNWIDTYIKPGQTLWDIGASIGVYTLYAGLNPGIKIFAFEPSALNFSLLVEHIALNGMGDRITPVCAALSDETKIGVLHMSAYDTGSAGNALGAAETQSEGFAPVFSQGIPAFTADDFRDVFRLPPPDHIKLDVDGIEGAILKGLARTLPHVSSVMIEVEGRNAEAAAEIIDPAFAAAGLTEDPAVRGKGSGRNRLYINPKKMG